MDTIWFSPMADTLLKMTAAGTIQLLTTEFTRIRIPILIDDGTLKEKLVLFTSPDRTMVSAVSSRVCDPMDAIGHFKYNTPIVLCIVGNANTVVKVELHSRGAIVRHYDIPLVFNGRNSRFAIPQELDIGSNTYYATSFDANIPQKKTKHFA